MTPRSAPRSMRRTAGAVLVPPFDDRRTIAGQGTVVRELLQQLGRAPDVVDRSGRRRRVDRRRSSPTCRERAPWVRIIGVEPAGAPSMTAALRAGGPVRLETMDPFVDGAAVRRIGALPYDIVAAADVQMLGVDEGAICTAMLRLYQNEGIVAEPAGALAVAALAELDLTARFDGGRADHRWQQRRLAVRRDRRALAGATSGLKHYFLVDFPQEPGALRRFLDEVLGPDDDITLFEYVKRNNRETGPALVGVEIGSADGLSALLARMAAAPMEVERIMPGSAAYRYLT